MRDWIFVINGGAVSLFGCILAASFCGVLKDKRKRLTVYLGMAALLLGQGLAYILFGGEWVRRLYPLIAHLPLWMMLYFLSKDVFWSLFSVLFAYLCCQLRRWTALLITTVFAGDAFVQNLSELILTVPVLIVLLETVSPVMRGLSGVPLMEKCKLFVLPALYYAFDYATQIYAKSLIMEYPVVSEFMPFVCCLLYLTFLLYDSAGKRVKNEMRQVQHGLDIQLNQAVRQISAMRESQERARQYRHDLRHHLQYVSACIRNGQNDTAPTI